MKRMLFLLIGAIAMSSGNAQTLIDGLRYSTDAPTIGTARYNAMSGAFGALGGDMSAFALNPAGSAVFSSNSATGTFGVLGSDNNTGYFGRTTNSNESDININQAGVVFVFDNPAAETSPLTKVTVGLNFNTTQNFDDAWFARGNGTTTIGQFFIQQAQGVPQSLLALQPGETIDDLYAFLGETEGPSVQNAFLGFQGFIFDPDEDVVTNDAYLLNIAPGTFNQDYAFLTNGYMGKYTVNVAAEFMEYLFVGLNLNSHTIDYDERTRLVETNSNAGSIVNFVDFDNSLSVLGSGFSAQIGAIAKIEDYLRIGITYDTPTWFDISEETTQYLETDRTLDGQVLTSIVDPRVINVFADYRLRTPGRFGASAAVVFGKTGLLSFDYGYRDYSRIKFSRDPILALQNSVIENFLTAASSYRVGGEYRIKNFSLRGGYHYEESPYQNGTTIGDLSGYSAGAGYSFGHFSVDVSYSRSERSRNQQLYSIGLTDAATIDNTLDNVLLTVGFSM